MTVSINGISFSAGCVVGAARMAGCGVMYSTVLALVPCMLFQGFIFWLVHVNILSGKAKTNKVMWRRNTLQDASADRSALAHSHVKRARAKARHDFADALLTTGWWEEGYRLKEHTQGQARVMTQTSWLSVQECDRVSNVVISEAQLVPALFLRSREGMTAAQEASSLQHFLADARNKLDRVVSKLSSAQLKKVGVVEPAVQKLWAETATNLMWPAHEDCYRQAIVFGITPGEVTISNDVRETISASLAQIKNVAQTEYNDSSGSFALGHRALYKRFAGNSAYQIHFMSVQIMVHFLHAFVLGAVSGPLQCSVAACLHAINVVFLVFFRPFKNRLQNLKQLCQATARTFILVLALMNSPRPGLESHPAANQAAVVSILMVSLGMDAVSPVLGSLRALIGLILVCCQLQKRKTKYMSRSAPLSRIFKYLIGEQRHRSSMYLRPLGLKRATRTWETLGKKVKLEHETQKLIRSLSEEPSGSQSLYALEDKTAQEEVNVVLQSWREATEQGLAQVQDAVALEKWLGVHILPRVVALAADASQDFCASHLASDDALADLGTANCIQTFLALTKEHFLRRMLTRLLLVVPNAQDSQHLLDPSCEYTLPGACARSLCF